MAGQAERAIRQGSGANNEMAQEFMSKSPTEGGVADGPNAVTRGLVWSFNNSVRVFFDQAFQIVGDDTIFDPSKWLYCLNGEEKNLAFFVVGNSFPAGVGAGSPYLGPAPGGPFISMGPTLGGTPCDVPPYDHLRYLGGDPNIRGANGRALVPFIVSLIQWFPPD